MRKIIDDNEDGLTALLGERVTVRCSNYTYAGLLDGVNDICMRLDDASMVFETGDVSKPGYATAERIPKPVYLMLGTVESLHQEL